MKKILIVDNEPEFLKGLEYALVELEGFFVKYALSSEEAKIYLADYRFDLIILDLIIPPNPPSDRGYSESTKENGLKLLEDIRSELNLATPIIGYTVVREIEIINMFNEIEKNHNQDSIIFSKPSSIMPIIDAIKRIINN